MNNYTKFWSTLFLFSFLLLNQNAHAQLKSPNEKLYRPAIHFTPLSNWMNDPNGMVYYNGVYHLFYQHNPEAPVWGPMHWGHATSKDLMHWKHLPIAIYPDSLGTIFSGSAVVDKNNTSGFGDANHTPLVAIYTQHSMEGEKAGKNDFQNQSIAYSLDAGKTWVPYKGNPVIKTPQRRDFRDPKVFWHEKTNQWVMVLAVGPFIEIYNSGNLKDWEKVSQVGGEGMGVHDGNWECPDLISFEVKDNLSGQNKTVWVLIVNVNPGAPNKGSGTQYFVGDFDGKKFAPFSKKEKWMDYGPDNYAGVTWSNTGERKILAGWMSNWLYARDVPTTHWRSGLTIPRELNLVYYNNEYRLVSEPVKELSNLVVANKKYVNILLDKPFHFKLPLSVLNTMPCKINITTLKTENLELVLSNNKNEQVVIGFDKNSQHFFIDRTKSGQVQFQTDFSGIHKAPRISNEQGINMTVVIDKASVELFADQGLTVMTELFFPSTPFNNITLRSSEKAAIKSIQYTALKSIY